MRPIFGAIAAVVVASSGIAPTATDESPRPPASRALVPACVLVQTDSRYVPYGYNHVVILRSSCQRDAVCAVTTNVNPTPIVVGVPPGATVEVLTFMAAPQPSFVASVSCELRGSPTRAVLREPRSRWSGGRPL
jgi:hypothetical protein